MSLAHVAEAAASAARTLPDVGAPASLLLMALLGLVILAVGLVALLASRRS